MSSTELVTTADNGGSETTRIMQVLDDLRIQRRAPWGYALLRLAGPAEVRVRVIYCIDGQPDVDDAVYPLNDEYWPKAYADAVVEWTGPLMPDPGPFGERGMPDWPCLRLEQLSAIGFSVEGRHRLIAAPGRAACARLRWWPDRQPELSLVRDTPCPDHDLLWASRAFEVLTRFPTQVGRRRGRTRGWRLMSPDEFHSRLTQSTAELTEELGREPTVGELATRIGISEATFRRWSGSA